MKKIRSIAILSLIAGMLMQQNTLALCPCNASPTIQITTPSVVCSGTNLRQASSTPGQDCIPKTAVNGVCPSCNPCPPDQVSIVWADNDLGPGFVTLSVSISACCGSDSDSKTVVVVGVVDIAGQSHACAGESRTYTVTTIPVGYYDNIIWTLIKDGIEVGSGAGQSFTVTFISPGAYTVQATCGSSMATKAVLVGADSSAPESIACDPNPSVPNGDSGNYTKIVTPFHEWYTGSWTLTYRYDQVAASSIGPCHEQAHTGAIQQNSQWTLTGTIEAQIGFLNINVVLGYTSPSTLSYSGFGAGGTDNIKYKVKAGVIIGTFSYDGLRHLKDPVWNVIRTTRMVDSDDFSASDLLPTVCRWCCS